MSPTQYLDRPGGRIAYDDTGGTGPVVLCIPGIGDLRSEYRHLRPLLVAAGHRVVTMDLRGHGDSSVGWDEIAADHVGRDVVALLDALAVERAVVLGCSLGAAAAVWAAAERPDAVRGLGLLGPFVRDVPAPWWQSLLIGLVNAWTWPGFVAKAHASGGPEDLDQHVAAIRSNLREPGRSRAVRAMLRASKDPCEARLPEVTATTVVVMGGADPDFPDPAAEADLVARRLHGTAVVLDGLGHYPHAEDAPTVAALVVDLVEQTCHAPA